MKCPECDQDVEFYMKRGARTIEQHWYPQARLIKTPTLTLEMYKKCLASGAMIRIVD